MKAGGNGGKACIASQYVGKVGVFSEGDGQGKHVRKGRDQSVCLITKGYMFCK